MAFSFLSPAPQPQQQNSPFQTLAQPSPFQQTNLLLQQQQQQQQHQHQQQQQQQLFLFTNDKSPANYSTKWADLHPDSQKILLQIEDRILEYRAESLKLDECSRLYDSSVSNDGFELDASHIVQELGGISTAMEREKVLQQELMAVVKIILRNTEVAVRSFMMLLPRFIHSNTLTPSATSSAQISAGTIVPSSTSHPMSSSIPILDFYSGIPKKPSPFLLQTATRFEKFLGECRQWIEELEQLLLPNTNGKSLGNDLSLLNSLPKVMSNVHDFFVHVAAQVESLHQYIESMKTAYLADQKHRGYGSDPFLEADRRETAKQEAAARRVHPTLHLPAPPATQVTSLFASSEMPGAATVSHSSVGTSAATVGSGFSLFSTPSSSAPSAAASSPSLFATPSASATTTSLFGTPSFSPQPSLFGSASTSMFGSAQTPSMFGSAQTPSMFGAATQSISSTPATGSSPLFSTPFATGPATGSGASFGATSKSSKPKSRTARR